MNRIVMVEGCDRTGKSSFIGYLEDKIRKEGYIILADTLKKIKLWKAIHILLQGMM